MATRITRTTGSAVDLAGLDALDGLGVVSYAALLQGEPGTGRQRHAASNAVPLLVPIGDIEERSHQVRQRFQLDDLRASIRDNLGAGRPPIKTPLIVKAIPGRPGKWELCDGARRLRSARLEGVGALPVIADPDFDDFDQVVVNLQRDGNTPVEIADFIAMKLAEGCRKGEIARRLGMSNSWVSKHAALIGMPASIRQGYDASRIHDVEAMYLLVAAYKNNQARIDRLCIEGTGPISKYTVMKLPESGADTVDATPPAAGTATAGGHPGLAPVAHAAHLAAATAVQQGARASGEQEVGAGRGDPCGSAQVPHTTPDQDSAKPPQSPGPTLLKRPLVQVMHKHRPATLLMAACAPGGLAWIRYDATGEKEQVPISSLTLAAIVTEPSS